MPAIEKNDRTTLFMALIMLGLFFSKILVFLTPLPLIYHQLKTKNAEQNFVLIVLPLVAAVYIFGTGAVFSLYQNYPMMAWLLPVPLVELTTYFSHSVVATMGILYFAGYLSLGFAIGLALQKSQAVAFKILIAVVVAVFVVTGLTLFLVASPQAATILADYRAFITEAFNVFIRAQEQSGLELTEILALKTGMKEYIETFFNMLPFVLFVTIVFLTALNVVIAKRFFAVFFKDLGLILLSEFKAPFALVWAFLSLVFILLINKKWMQSDPIFYSCLNLIMCLSVAYVLQGLAVVVHFFHRKNVDRFFRIMVYLTMIWMSHTTLIFLGIVGFFDNWMDLRKLEKKPTKTIVKL